MIGLALKMLFGDTAKYLMLVAGLFFATFLIVQQASVFCGLMMWTTSTLKNVGAPIFVVEERVEQINEINPLRDTDVSRVRSVSAVRWAMPLYSGIQRVRLENGSFKTVQLLGIDAASLAGGPVRMIEGNLEDLRLPNTVVIDELAVTRLSEDKQHPIKVGDRFEINDIEARVVGICQAMRSFTGGPYLWTTYERALQYTPASRKMLSAVIAAPIEGMTPDEAAAEITRETGLRAYVNRGFGDNPDDFNTSTVWWYVKNTGIPISFGTTVVIGFIVGIAIACQTFYAFVLDNLKHLGALKAMGMTQFPPQPDAHHPVLHRRADRLRHRAVSHLGLRLCRHRKPATALRHAMADSGGGLRRHPAHLHGRRAVRHRPPQPLRTRHGLPRMNSRRTNGIGRGRARRGETLRRRAGPHPRAANR